MYNELYKKQVLLLLECLPAIREHPVFALKGGTAINLFLKELPRLSVDIDLTYWPIKERNESIHEIQTALKTLEEAIHSLDSRITFIRQYDQTKSLLLKIIAVRENIRVKIEPNFVLRGALFPVVHRAITARATEHFTAFIDNIPLLSTAEIYAGKICAALSRQHPRDLFDIKLLLDTEEISNELRQAFVVYLASNPRPIHELLAPNSLDLSKPYETAFAQMTEYPMPLEVLVQTREKLITIINASLKDNERQFLLSVKQGTPDYTLLPFENLDQFPALRWKIMNIRAMSKEKHRTMLKKLEDILMHKTAC